MEKTISISSQSNAMFMLPTGMRSALALLLSMVFFVNLSGQSTVAYLHTSVNKEKRYPINSRSEYRIPFQLIRGMIVLEATIDSEPGNFILDTGAPLMVINQAPDVPSRLATSFKEDIEVGETTIQHFGWAGIEEKSLEALVLDISHLESAFKLPLKGMIGFNVIKDYELFFDYERQLILRYPARKNFLHTNAKPIYSIPFQLYDHLPVITVQIGSRKLTLGLDTGACINMIDRSVLDELEANTYLQLPDEEVQGLDQQINQVQAVQMVTTTVKDLVVSDLKFLATEMPKLRSSEGLPLDGLLGYSFLSRMKTSINYAKRRIYVWE